MIRSSIFSSLILSLVLVAGCEKDPPQTTPPGDGQTASTDGDGKKPKKGPKGEGGDKQPDGPSAEENDPTKKVCPAETADFPEAYFEMTVLIRLPKGVTADNFVEMQPGLATLAADVESVSCIPDMPGAMITHMALASFPDDKAKDMTVWRDEIVEAFGYAGATYSEEKVDNAKRHYQAAIELPAANGAEPAKALLTIVAANDFMYALVQETHPDAWNALKETFYTVSSKMSFRKA